MNRVLASALLVLFVSIIGEAYAGDSPQFRGPSRDGRFDEHELLKTWPESGPPTLWVANGIGKGYSSASVVGGAIYISGMLEDQSGSVSVLDTSGKVTRKIAYGKETVEAQAPGARSTPTLDGGRLYLLSGLGVLYCLDINTGEKKWEVNVLETFGGELPSWHIAESVLVDGDRVICTPGGKDAVMVALDKMTGKTLWATSGVSDKASYCSPTIINHGGRRILTTVTGSYVVGADAQTGKLLWTFEHHAPYDIHAVTPLYKDGLLYYVGGDGSGGGALKLAPDGASVTPVWSDKTLDCLHSGVVLVDGYLYGAGYKNGGELECMELATGKIMWHTKDVQQGAVVYADGMLYVYEGPKSGVVSLVKADPHGFARTGQFKITEGGADKHWAHPTIANGVLYVRHGDALIAYDVRGKR